MLALLTAAAMTLPSASMADATALRKSIPNSAKRDKRYVAAAVQTWVAPTGEIESCTPTIVYGDGGVAQIMCNALKGRTIKPAKDAGGLRAYALYDTSFYFTADDPGEAKRFLNRFYDLPRVADIELTILSRGQEATMAVPLIVLVSKDGDLARCEGAVERDERYVALACEHAEQFPFEQRSAKDGAPVPYIRTLQAEFKFAAAS